MIKVSDIKREAHFLFRQRAIVWMLFTAFALSVFSVWSGMAEIETQRETIHRLIEKDTLDRADALSKHNDFGSVAYYSFHLTYNEPSTLAFAAIGQRDVFPWKHRVRMLALEGQIYETDADNPELSLVGRFDFAFYISVLLPLFILLLTYNIRVGEREAGRHDLLLVTAASKVNLWLIRALVLNTALSILVLTPFWGGALISQVSLSDVAVFTLIVIANSGFWCLTVLYVSTHKRFASLNSTRIASVLVGIWLVLTVVVPVVVDTLVESAVPSPNGGEIVLTQREAVNDAWDLPFSSTWDAFIKRHPEWAGKTTMESSFEWKWYYAFQQVGDQKAEALSLAYRSATEKRNSIIQWLAVLSPPMLSQRLMTAIAGTDTSGMLAYETRVREFHQSLRQFYYPLLFNKVEFSQEKLKELPQFTFPTTTKDTN